VFLSILSPAKSFMYHVFTSSPLNRHLDPRYSTTPIPSFTMPKQEQDVVIAPTGSYKINASAREDEKAVKSWGFSHVFTWSDGPYVSLVSSTSCVVSASCRVQTSMCRRQGSKMVELELTTRRQKRALPTTFSFWVDDPSYSTGRVDYYVSRGGPEA